MKISADRLNATINAIEEFLYEEFGPIESISVSDLESFSQNFEIPALTEGEQNLSFEMLIHLIKESNICQITIS